MLSQYFSEANADTQNSTDDENGADEDSSVIDQEDTQDGSSFAMTDEMRFQIILFAAVVAAAVIVVFALRSKKSNKGKQ